VAKVAAATKRATSGDKAAKKKSANTYDVHPSVTIMQKWIAELKGQTGRSLEEWVALTQKDGPADGHKARVEWLRQKHKLNNNAAWHIAERAGGKGFEGDSPEAYLAAAEKYVEEQYSGRKEHLRPLYEQLLETGRCVAEDTKVCPCQTMVPFYRNHVFAQIKATTNSRIDVGFALAKYKGKLPKRLIDTGGLAKKDRITHRIEITDASQIDIDLKKWLTTAYELDAD
jgi:Domain of unknown function (DUF5655)/Domain of unknown function (DUF4287)